MHVTIKYYFLFFSVTTSSLTFCLRFSIPTLKFRVKFLPLPLLLLFLVSAIIPAAFHRFFLRFRKGGRGGGAGCCSGLEGAKAAKQRPAFRRVMPSHPGRILCPVMSNLQAGCCAHLGCHQLGCLATDGGAGVSAGRMAWQCRVRGALIPSFICTGG